MKRILAIAVSVVLVAALVAGFSTAFAAKPTNVIENSNGFPSGMHFNLNIHGKKADYVCDPNSGGRSVFVLEYGDSTIQYVSNKRASITELTVIDSCAEAFDLDPAVVQLPYNILLDDGVTKIPAEGYYVYAAIKGKPQNGLSGNESSIVIWPNPILEACNITNPDPSYGSDLVTCPYDDLWILGLITSQGVYDFDPGDNVFVRFDQPETDSGKGQGKSAGKDITGLFTWSGWVGNQTEFDTLDINDDEVLDNADVPSDLTPYEPGIWDYDADSNGVIDINEWLDYRADVWGIGTFYHNVWVFDIADIVIQDQKVVNDGAKLLQVRFYPVATTIFR